MVEIIKTLEAEAEHLSERGLELIEDRKFEEALKLNDQAKGIQKAIEIVKDTWYSC